MLAGKIAAVIDGMRGIGRAVSLTLCAAGVRVVATTRSQSATEVFVREVRGQGGDTSAFALNVADPSLPHGLIDKVVTEYGRPNAIVPKSEINSCFVLAELPTPDRRDEVNSVKLRQRFLVAQMTARHLLMATSGSVAFIASVLSMTGVPRRDSPQFLVLDRHRGSCVHLESSGPT